jgi:hypothetical protein
MDRPLIPNRVAECGDALHTTWAVRPTCPAQLLTAHAGAELDCRTGAHEIY